MKKIEELLQRERLADNTEFRSAYQAYQNAKTQRNKARESHRTAKEMYRKALATGEQDAVRLAELEHALQKEKHMSRYHREDLRLMRFKLQNWVDNFLKNLMKSADKTEEHAKPGQNGSKKQVKNSKKIAGESASPLQGASKKSKKSEKPAVESKVKTETDNAAGSASEAKTRKGRKVEVK